MDPSGSNRSIVYTLQSNHLFAIYSKGSTNKEGDLHMTGLIDHQDTWWLVSVLSQVCQYPLPGKGSRLAHSILDGVEHTYILYRNTSVSIDFILNYLLISPKT